MIKDPNFNLADAGATVVWIAAFAQILPVIAAFLSVVWFMIRIAESEMFAWGFKKVFRFYPPWYKEKKDEEN